MNAALASAIGWLHHGNGGATTLKVTRVWGEADSQSGHTAVPRSSGGSSATTVLVLQP